MADGTQSGNGKARAPRNRTLVLTDQDRDRLRTKLIRMPPADAASERAPEGVICGDFHDSLTFLPRESVDLLFLDPPYNLNKDFNGRRFAKRSVDEYTAWLDSILNQLNPLLKPTATIYICGDWLSSCSVFEAASKHFKVRNRITWEREKGRGAKTNWKNASEDIWFCTVSDDYCFNVDDVKLRRRVIAPYRHGNGKPKDWNETNNGNFRDTHPSNLWTDISIPFWSMQENTDHPTQKSEKLLAKLILASTRPGDMVFDPFLGSGTSVVVAKKLNRRFLGIEIDEEFALLALRRLERADEDMSIQGYAGGVFWERNTLSQQQSIAKSTSLRSKPDECSMGRLF